MPRCFATSPGGRHNVDALHSVSEREAITLGKFGDATAQLLPERFVRVQTKCSERVERSAWRRVICRANANNPKVDRRPR